MPQYLASLSPEQTIDSVFDNLYGQTAEVAGKVLKIHTDEHGHLIRSSDSRSVSGTDLSIKVTSGFKAVSKQIETVRIFAHFDGDYFPLISLENGVTSSEATNLFMDPIKVEAFRDRERGCADYSLERRGRITARLARLGISGNERSIPDEPYGKTIISAATNLGEMGEQDYEKIGFISQGIVRGVAAASLLLAGASAKDVLTLQGRHLDNSDYVHPTSAGALKPETLQDRKYPLVNLTQIAAAA